MSKLKIIALSRVVYKVKSTDASTEPCGTPYESVILSDRVSLIITDWCLFFKTKFEHDQIFHTNQKVYPLM